MHLIIKSWPYPDGGNWSRKGTIVKYLPTEKGLSGFFQGWLMQQKRGIINTQGKKNKLALKGYVNSTYTVHNSCFGLWFPHICIKSVQTMTG